MAGRSTRLTREDGTADDLRLADQPELCGRDAWGRGRDDEPTRHRVVVQAGPRGFDFFQLAQDLPAEAADRAGLCSLRWVRPELVKELLPGERERCRQ